MYSTLGFKKRFLLALLPKISENNGVFLFLFFFFLILNFAFLNKNVKIKCQNI